MAAACLPVPGVAASHLPELCLSQPAALTALAVTAVVLTLPWEHLCTCAPNVRLQGIGSALGKIMARLEHKMAAIRSISLFNLPVISPSAPTLESVLLAPMSVIEARDGTTAVAGDGALLTAAAVGGAVASQGDVSPLVLTGRARKLQLQLLQQQAQQQQRRERTAPTAAASGEQLPAAAAPALTVGAHEEAARQQQQQLQPQARSGQGSTRLLAAAVAAARLAQQQEETAARSGREL